MKKILLYTWLMLSVFTSFGQTPDASRSSSENAKFTVQDQSDSLSREFDDTLMEKDDGIYSLLTTKEFWLSVGVLLLLLIILAIEAVIIRYSKFSEDAAIKLLVMTIVILGVLFLFVSGYSDKQVAPAFGLFGTISGYIFGKSSNKNSNE